MTILLDAPATTAAPTELRLFTAREMEQRVADAEFDFKVRAIKIALRAARASSEGDSAWDVLDNSSGFQPRDYLPTERFRVILQWTRACMLPNFTGIPTPESLFAEQGAPDLEEMREHQDAWAFGDVKRDLAVEDIAWAGNMVSYTLVATFSFTAAYEGPLMDGGVTADHFREALTWPTRRDAEIQSFIAEPVQPLSPPRVHPESGDDEPRFTENDVDLRIRGRIDELKREIAALGMQGKRENEWCYQAEETLREIGVPEEYIDDESGESEADETWVEFTLTRTLTVRARRIDSSELPDSDWVQSSITHDADIRMDSDWDDVEVVRVSDSVTEVYNPAE